MTSLSYHLVRSHRRKRTLSLSLRQDGVVLVQAPLRMPSALIDAFVQGKQAWIDRQQSRQRQHQQGSSLHDGCTVYRLGEPLTLTVITDRLRKQPVADMTDSGLVVHCPQGSFPPTAASLFHALQQAYRHAALFYLQQRTAHFCKHSGLQPRGVKLSAARRQWGSCSSDNIIRYSWRAYALPPELIDYLVVHELCHIAHKNHSPRFWAMVEQLMPDYRQRSQELKECGGRLTANLHLPNL